eukprot:gnl/TRDRNA2_/TRDRNA2_167921_c0_seq1.p1 gnl/TRDRNA2_/TRDRNA2_167921_c0~~gnl/TRDRNA2_/TRDRNA2_167921_c0_seq1.p1  ORF type:complete len:177 (+),score=41.17 gnl/TRDRNA2_/TRDRNA2_167921_c0_seq1:2-532(+)
MNSELLDESLENYHQRPKDFPSHDMAELLRSADMRHLLRKLILHLSDIANPTKPFKICKLWALKCLDEFFLQGDKEKELGIPLQSLNDRDQVNKSFSQIVFIEFLVAPLTSLSLKVLFPLEPIAAQLLSNIRKWQDLWAAETTPSPPESERSAVEKRIKKIEDRLIGITSRNPSKT